jgi:hypothetical protein
MVQYHKSDFKVACSMVRWVDANPKADPVHVYASYWMAFNNIYVTLADFSGKRVRPNRHRNGSVKMKPVYGCDMPDVEKVSERDQIGVAINELAASAKADLVGHENVGFFVNRAPVYHSWELEQNKAGQKLNGVLNVGHSIDDDYPVWTPLSREAHAKIKSNSASKAEIDLVAKQVVEMLYTIRNNLFHGGKRADDAQNQDVLKNAVPLLEIVVRFFLRDSET